MKPVDKKDMPKLIALIVLTVCCLSFGIYSLVGGTSDASPPAPKVQKQTQAVAQSPSNDALLVEIKRLEGISDPILVRDPFTTTGGAIGVATATPAPPAPSTQPSPSPQDVAITAVRRPWGRCLASMCARLSRRRATRAAVLQTLSQAGLPAR